MIFKHCVDDVRFTLLDFLTDLCVDFGVLNIKKFLKKFLILLQKMIMKKSVKKLRTH